MPVQAPARRLFTVDEFYRMGDAGIFREEDRVELIDGEIIQMTPIGSWHAACVSRLAHTLYDSIGREHIVRAQDPIRLDDYSEPQPDIAVVKHRDDFYSGEHPTPADVLLLIEVAESSADFDRHQKLPLYARSGIPETWIVDLDGGFVDVHRQAGVNGYREHTRLGRGDTVSSPSMPGLELSVTDLVA